MSGIATIINMLNEILTLNGFIIDKTFYSSTPTYKSWAVLLLPPPPESYLSIIVNKTIQSVSPDPFTPLGPPTSLYNHRNPIFLPLFSLVDGNLLLFAWPLKPEPGAHARHSPSPPHLLTSTNISWPVPCKLSSLVIISSSSIPYTLPYQRLLRCGEAMYDSGERGMRCKLLFTQRTNSLSLLLPTLLSHLLPISQSIQLSLSTFSLLFFFYLSFSPLSLSLCVLNLFMLWLQIVYIHHCLNAFIYISASSIIIAIVPWRKTLQARLSFMKKMPHCPRSPWKQKSDVHLAPPACLCVMPKLFPKLALPLLPRMTMFAGSVSLAHSLAATILIRWTRWKRQGRKGLGSILRIAVARLLLEEERKRRKKIKAISQSNFRQVHPWVWFDFFFCEKERKKERERERTGRKERKQENRGNIFRLDRDIEHLVHSHLQPLWRTPF